MLKTLNELLLPFCACFSRQATFEWFVVLIIGFMLCFDHLGMTSVIRDLSLNGRSYETLLHFFRSSAWSLSSLRKMWLQVVRHSAPLLLIQDRVVLVGDGMKQAKEAHPLEAVQDEQDQRRIEQTIQAIEGFVMCQCIAMGLLQLVALRFDPKDITFVLFTMASGLACGVGSFGYAVFFTLILCVLMFILSRTNFGVRKISQKTLKVTIPEDLGYEEAFAEVFTKYNVKYELKKIKTTELGSLYELVYMVTLNEITNQKDFLDAIRCRNGNLDLSLTMSPTTSDY